VPLVKTGNAALTVVCGDPMVEIVAPVKNASAEAEAVRSGAEVAPVPQGGDGGAEEFGGFGDGEQFGLAAGGMVRHGLTPVWSVGKAPSPEKAPKRSSC
jgi:hypothetical protein